MKSLMALAVVLSTFAIVGVATTSPAEAHFKKRHHHAKYYKAGKCKKHVHWFRQPQEVPQALVIPGPAWTTDGAAPPGAALFLFRNPPRRLLPCGGATV